MRATFRQTKPIRDYKFYTTSVKSTIPSLGNLLIAERAISTM
ncbi:MAG: hypothetical protein NTY12_00330 [Candidatus Falkowbacteria bacterium]|nr:hypothetical protein [Candidatus Falkowbacteria bacterium]